ncbi:MAG: PDZ domain-containing protein [Bacteroidales bacterium]|nr:PDZ domain-containing protein [Bacteroidales bacterium]
MKNNLMFILAFVLMPFLQNSLLADEARLLRFPALHGDQVVFTYAGELYTVDRAGGVARKLTNHPGYKMFARFSPDGSHIAFTGQYDGNTEVYVMPARGGVPQRLTFTATLSRDDLSDRMGPNNIVMTWRDNETIVFRSRKRSFNAFKGSLFMVNMNGGLPEQIPVPEGGWISFSEDGQRFVYNRVFREFRTWKYYAGGMADDLWLHDLNERTTVNLTNHKSQDVFPMWFDDRVYFLSDRDGRMNLFCYDINSQQTRKLTHFEEFDIKFPSAGTDAIIFENGGYLYTFDLAAESVSRIPVTIAEDMALSRRQRKDASQMIRTASLSPDGNRIAFGARGDVWSVPAKSGITRNLTQTSGVHERNVTWSPDGKYIAFVSDVSGEDEIYIMQQDGREEAIQITTGADTYKYSLSWSPDSEKIMWSDKMLRLQYVDINTREVTIVEQAEAFEINQFTWSPDSRWISYTRPETEHYSRIFLYNTRNGEKFPVTDGWYASSSPSFCDKGNYLFFVSNRDFNPIYSRTEWNHAYTDMSRIYFVTLREDVPSFLEPKNDEVKITNGNDATGGSSGPGGNDELRVEVDRENIKNRIDALPVDVSSYFAINVVGDNIYYMKRSFNDTRSSLMMFNMDSRQESTLSQINGYQISADQKKMLVAERGRYAIIDLPRSSFTVSDFVDVSNMKVWVDLKEEWVQIYNETWRQMRDFFYAPNMHGVDWEAMRDKYRPLVDYVNNRLDLTYILGELVGELNVGHAYVGGGDVPEVERIPMGLLGAELSHHRSGYYRIDRILKGENWYSSRRSPLTELGVNVKEGEYIIAVNGQPTDEMANIYEALIGTADQQVELRINDRPRQQGARDVIVVPVRDEADLYYYNWVQENIRKVSEATGGRVGYIHIPDMGPGGLNEFVKHFYPQLRKEALIIDVRGNGGGNVSPMLIERLSRELTSLGMSRNTAPTTRPAQIHLGPKVCLIDKYSASDGDLFPFQFQKLGLGPLIGTTSWGGVVGIRGSLPFIDGGTLSKPEFAPYDIRGEEWIIEGIGVHPDIYVENDPTLEFDGIDEQLNRGIQEALRLMEEYDQIIHPVPPFPDRSRQ